LAYINGQDYIIKLEQQVVNKSFEILQLSEQDTEKG
jgi:hypothetical protein